MQHLSRLTQLAKRLGIETAQYKAYFALEEKKKVQDLRKEAFLHEPRDKSLKQHPELKDVFAVYDAALRFYQDFMGDVASNPNTRQRNVMRAQSVSLEALTMLDEGKDVIAYVRRNREKEAHYIKEEEMRTLRHELNQSYEDNVRVNPKLAHNADKRFADYVSLYFEDEKKALEHYPELMPLKAIKKEAVTHYSRWLKPELIEKATKECLYRALLDISRGFPPQSAEEIQEEAKRYNFSLMGVQSNVPNEVRKRKAFRPQIVRDQLHYEYSDKTLMELLIGRNGIKTGYWPFNPNLLTVEANIQAIDEHVLTKQYQSFFDTQPKDGVLNRYPELTPLYQKYEKAQDLYREKVAHAYVDKAARLLIDEDFKAIALHQPLKATSEIDSTDHDLILLKVRDRLKTEGKNQNLIVPDQSGLVILNTLNQLQTITIESTYANLSLMNDANFEQDNVVSSSDKHRSIQLINELKEELKNANNPILLEKLNALEARLGEPLKPASMDEGLTRKMHETINDMSFQIAKTSQEEIGYETPIFLPSSDGVLKEDVFDLSRLRSTAIPLNMDALFKTSHQAKTIQEESSFERFNVDEINDGLKEKSAELAKSLLGKPLFQDKSEMRFGSNKGSLVVTIEGLKQGLWYDHQTGKGGNLLTLIQETKNVSFKEALAYASEFLGVGKQKRFIETIDLSDLNKNTEISDKKRDTIRYARELANLSKPIEDTLAETYLNETRLLDATLASSMIRFLPSVKEPETEKNHPALLVIGKNNEGQTQGVQVIYLDEQGKKLSCKNPKRSYGIIKSSAVPVHEGGNIYAVAEGVETALSVAKANPELTVFASLGSVRNFSAMPLEGKNNTLIIYADNDGANKKTAEGVAMACEELSRKGFNVFVCKPTEAGKDFNDILREKGIEALREETKMLRLYESHVKTQEKVMQAQRELSLSKKTKIELEKNL